MYNGPGQAYVQAEFLPPHSSNVDWERKPSQFKQYQNCARLPLPFHLSQNHHATPVASITLEQIGELLANSYGLLQQYYAPQLLAAGIPTPQGLHAPNLRRPVPSGGALFPCEIYLFSAAGQYLPAGIYHYDVAHHALDILRQCDATALVRSLLAHPGPTRPAYILALSCAFWKDGFKYGDFSYRLQGFDLGTVIAQCTAVLDQQGLSTSVHYQFLDTNMNMLLGLDSQSESIYALITVDSIADAVTTSATTAIQARPQQVAPSVPQLTSIAYWPLVETVHKASLINAHEQFRPLACLPEITPPSATVSYPLPSIGNEPALLTRYQQRHSANGRFIPTPITLHQLALLCHFSSPGYRNDLDEQITTLRHTLLYCVVNRVEEIPSGIYCYNSHFHSLELIVSKNVKEDLQWVQRGHLVNAYDLSVCFFAVGNYNTGFYAYGDRWYRMQNMEAGMMVQRLYLTAASLQLGCRASLGFHQSRASASLQLPEHWHALIQVMAAPEAFPHAYYALPIHP